MQVSDLEPHSILVDSGARYDMSLPAMVNPTHYSLSVRAQPPHEGCSDKASLTLGGRTVSIVPVGLT